MLRASKNILSPVILLGFLFIINEFVLCEIPPIVFVSRNYESNGNQYYNLAGLHPGMGPFSRFKVVGGKLLVRESNGIIRVLVDSTISFNGINLIDVSDPCVFWNGSKIIFAGTVHRDSCWRIYEINTDGSGFRQITFSNRNINLSQFGQTAFKFLKYHDIDPCYLPDGRICFASTRYPSLSEINSFPATNLYVINSDLSGLHRITTERNGAEEPTIDPVTGRIVYSRWWVNIDMPSVYGITRDSNFAISKDIGNLWQANSIKPDGDALQLYSGDATTRKGIFTYKPYIMPDGKLLSVFVPNLPMTFTSGSTGIRWFSKGVSFQNHVSGVNQDNMQLYNNNPPSFGTMQPPYSCDPVLLPDGKLLISYATDVEQLDYGLYTINLDGTNLQFLFNIPGKLELNSDFINNKFVPPIVPDQVTDISNELPPTIDPSTYFKNGGFRFDCVNIFMNGQVDEPMKDAPPITKNAKILFYLNFQRQDQFGLDTPILFAESPVTYSGGINMDFVPADVSMFEQVIDSSRKVIRVNNEQAAHVTGLNFGRNGTGTKCVGCHAGHTAIPVPINNSQGQYSNYSTSASVTQSSFRYINDSLQYPGSKVKDRKARNNSLLVNWVASGSQNEWVDMHWVVPIDIRRIKLYNVLSNPAAGTTIQVNDCEVKFYFQNNLVYQLPSTGIISSSGTEFNIPNEPKIDELKVTIKNFTGNITGQNVAGLAEVEINSKISFYELNGIRKITEISNGFSLEQNYPNPFNPSTKIKFTLPSLSSKFSNNRLTTLSVYNSLGQLVKILVSDYLKTGKYEIDFNGTGLSSGIYFYILKTDGFSESKKMILLK